MGFLYPYRERSLPDLIRAVQAVDDQLALAEILHRFEPLTKSLGRRMAEGHHYRDDIEGAARSALVRAAARHRGDTDTFPGYAKRYMTGAALRELQRWLVPVGWSHCQLDALVPAALPQSPPVDDEPDHAGFGDGPVANVIRQLRPNQQALLGQRYVEGASLAEIGAKWAISAPAVSQRLDTVHRAVQKGLAA